MAIPDISGAKPDRARQGCFEPPCFCLSFPYPFSCHQTYNQGIDSLIISEANRMSRILVRFVVSGLCSLISSVFVLKTSVHVTKFQRLLAIKFWCSLPRLWKVDVYVVAAERIDIQRSWSLYIGCRNDLKTSIEFFITSLHFAFQSAFYNTSTDQHLKDSRKSPEGQSASQVCPEWGTSICATTTSTYLHESRRSGLKFETVYMSIRLAISIMEAVQNPSR